MGKAWARGGFTLIELLVVVAILGVLAAVVTLNVGKFIGQGQTEAAATELHNVQTAVVASMADTPGTIPTTTDVLVTEGFLLGTPNGTYSIDGDTGKVTHNTYPPCVVADGT